MPNTKPWVIIPSKPVDLLGLESRVYAKYREMGTTSPLSALLTHKWEDNDPQIANAVTLHQKAEDYSRQAEDAYAKRNLLLSEIDKSLKATRDLLLGIYHDNPKGLVQWGFEVDDSVRAAKKQA